MFLIKRKIVGVMVLFLTCSNSLFSQELPANSVYIFNSFQINPAYAGFKDDIQITSMFRKQFIGIKNSPQSAYLGIEIPIANKQVGLGLQILDDRQYVSKTSGAQLAYSYKIQTGENSTLSMGLQMGLIDYNIDYARVDVIDANDPMFSQNISSFKLNFGTGLFFHTPQFYMGLSSPNLIRNNLNNNGSDQVNNVKQNIRAYFNTGYIFPISDNLFFTPSILVRAVERSPVSFDVNANLSIADKVSFGISYRDQSAIVGMFDLKILPELHLGYVYGSNTTQFNAIIKNTHEIVLRYEISFKDKFRYY